MATEKQYWLGLEDKEGVVNTNDKEFGQDLPALSSIAESISVEKSGRRDFLKMVGFSVTAAAIAASCEMPVRKSIPYTIKPEEIVPGIPNYYASSYIHGGNYNSVLVKTREGRPILVEGNKESAVSQGGVNPKTLGSLLSLYDNARIKSPLKNGEEVSWADADSDIAKRLEAIAAAEGKIAILSSTLLSPSTRKVVAKFAEKYPSTELVEFDAISYSGLLDANKESYGKRAVANYHFDKADLIVSVGADFLGTWVSPTEYAAAYAKKRKVSEANLNMNRHIQIESIPTLSGSNADLRIPVKPSEEDLAVVRLYNLLAKKAGATTVSDSSFENAKLESVANELFAAKGKSIVVSGSNNKNSQLLVNAINELLGNVNNTLDFTNAAYYRQGDDTKLITLLSDMKAGKVKALFVMNANPVYTLGDTFVEALAKVDLTVDFSERNTETTELVEYVCPTHHYLESWDDAMPKENVYATVQPTIAPLFNTRQAQESLLKLAGVESSYYDFIRANCKESVVAKSSFSGLELLWNNVVHDGEVVLADGASVEFNTSDVNVAAAQVVRSAKASEIEFKLYEKVQIGDGTVSDNPWMQELADPLTRITWDNYIVANPTWVKDNGLLHNHKNKAYTVATVTVNGYDITLPVVALPGVPKGVLGVAYGYGRTNNVHAELKRGVSVYPLVSRSESAVSFAVENWTKNSETQQMAIIQQEHRIDHMGLGGVKTRLIVKETSLSDYKNSPASGNYINEGLEFVDRKKWVEKHLNSLYGTPDSSNPAIKEYGAAHVGALSQGHHWGMGVDLNSCIGCGACVVACNVENNVPVVGRNEVRRAHDMNWLRIDKYHTGDDENPQVIFQPMMCQHCDNAPCENVCPVAATNHSTEGLNQMTYNRCIGTRYCANNCPYKVRRFNWYDYQGADSFSNNKGFVFNNDFDANDKAASFGSEPLGLHSPLAKMVLNPDVTVRSRGVIEKCSFCVQRVQLGKLEAKKAKRKLEDSDIVTACQSACPTNAITFGDTNNPESAVSKVWADPRAYGVIEEIHTLPSVRYLVKVRNQKTEDLEA
jgi:MoCo/4Fe-4S cofactor protein with predicted Tat translocation signal